MNYAQSFRRLGVRKASEVIKLKWIKDGLSLDETKVSALIIAFFITLIVALYQAVSVGDISDNVLMLLAYELGAFMGIKISEHFSPRKGKYSAFSIDNTNSSSNNGENRKLP